jgi:SAM-dependent methyltransferase
MKHGLQSTDDSNTLSQYCPDRSVRRIYENIDNPVWQVVVYNTLHDGWAFANMGGKEFLDFVGTEGRLRAGMQVLELCSGQGATCRYLVQHFGVEVTGIELIEKQVRLCQKAATRLDHSVSKRLHFVCGDITHWKGDRPNDAVYVVESLVLIDEPLHIMGEVCRSLRRGGNFFIGEMMAGPNITQCVREKVVREDAIKTILDPAEYTRAFMNNGFSDMRVIDKTALAEMACKRMLASVKRNREFVVRYEGMSGWKRWQRTMAFYANCFSRNELRYIWMRAKKKY